MKRFIATVAGMALVAAAAYAAETGIVRGRVVDEKGQIVPEAQILMEAKGGTGQKYSQKTSKKGEYIQVGVKSGPWRITATKEGYAGQFIELKVEVGEETKVPDLKIVSGGAGDGKPKTSAEAQAAFDKANQLAAAGDLDGAIASLNDVLAKSPGKPEVVHTRMGTFLMQKGDFPGAEAAYNKALEVKPGYIDAIRGLSNSYLKQRRGADAMAMLEKYTTDNPGDSEGQYLYGFVLFNAGKQVEAEAAFAKVLELDPTNAQAQYYMGMILVGKNKVPEAIAALQKYLDSNPNDPVNVDTATRLIAALSPKK